MKKHQTQPLTYEEALQKITSFIEKYLYAFLLLLIFINYADKTFLTLPYVDGDGYMRAIRIYNLVTNPSFFEQPVYQSNYPFGEISHWTRPMDILWLACALPYILIIP